mmetsp:Transcript_10242/g.30240  ORF Transcript_10242/g.30240 Transcript_10242/m.30240 type:complete len:131 (-) Transcript_10242:374-766(-)
MNDLKLSNEDENEVTKMIKWMKGIYGEDMKVSQGKKHDYLGMELDFSCPGEVKVGMVSYLKGIVTDFPEKIKGRASSPTVKYLFDVCPEGEGIKLNEERKRAFHHSTTQLLFLCPRGRNALQTTGLFLTT